MPTEAKVSIFMDNDLTHINDDHFEINLVAHLLNQLKEFHSHNLQKISELGNFRKFPNFGKILEKSFCLNLVFS